MKTKQVLECTLCGTEVPVPLCCKKQMQVQEGELVCSLCNAIEDIPICCGNVMINAQH